MPDGTSSLLGMAWGWIETLATALIGLLFYHGKRQQKQIDDMQEDYVPNARFEKSVDRLREDILNLHNETRQDIKDLSDKIK